MENLRNKTGKFFIELRFLDEHPDKVMLIMGQCLIWNADFDYGRLGIRYEAASPLFDEFENPAGVRGETPWYDVGVAEGQVIVSREPHILFRRPDGELYRCDFSGSTQRLFPYEYKDGEMHYRVDYALDEGEVGEVYYDALTGIQVVLGARDG